MLELLAPYGLADDPLELGVVGAGAQRPPQVSLVQREQTCAQAAVGGQPDPVAVSAEGLGDGVDEADLPPPVREPVHARGGMGLARIRLERVDGVDRRADLLTA